MDFANHVSCTHKISSGWASKSIYSFILLAPAIFMLPICMPSFFHLNNFYYLFLVRLVEPFVRLPCLPCALVGTLSYYIF